jgi:hypothetical protein
MVLARVNSTLASYCGGAGVRISVRIPAVVIRGFLVSPQSLHTNAAEVSSINVAIISFNTISNLLSTSRPTVRHYVI